MNVYKMLAEGGGYNLPFLARISTPDESTNIYVINDNQDMAYGGRTYAASNFTFTPNNNGDSQLNIELVEHDDIIDILDENYSFKIEIIGIYNGETVEALGLYKFKYGEGTWDGAKLQMKLNKDDRGNMTFPALIFNSYNNRGNA
jgi:hypothetical protein